jgi:hypothetical protein
VLGSPHVLKSAYRPSALLSRHNTSITHVVDAGTTYQAAIFLEGEGFVPVWNAFVKCWTRAYVGDPESITVDSDSVFSSAVFAQTCAAHEITMKTTGVESHSSHGVGERCHDPLRPIYRKIREENPGVERQVLLQCAVFAMNSTLGPDGLVPILLVYGQLPREPSLASIPPLTVKQRFSLMTTARAEYEQWVAQWRVATGLSKKPPESADRMYAAGEQVYVYLERHHAWTGPHKIISVNGKDVVLELPNGHQHFNVAMVNPSMTQTTEIRWTEVLQPNDPRRGSENMTSAIRAELMGLIKRGKFKLVELADASDKNVIPAKFVISIKHENGTEKFKARFCLGGHRDFMEKSMVHTATQLSRSSTRLILAVAAVLGFDV